MHSRGAGCGHRVGRSDDVDGVAGRRFGWCESQVGLLVGRVAGWSELDRVCVDAEVIENGAHDGGVCDRAEHAHAGRTVRTLERVEPEGAA